MLITNHSWIVCDYFSRSESVWMRFHRGEVIAKAGPEETVIYADIGEDQMFPAVCILIQKATCI